MSKPSRKAALTRSLVAAMFILALFAAPAAAVSVVYVGGDGDVHISPPDGSSQTRVTSDGTAQNPYRSPSQTDKGEIAAIKRTSESRSSGIFVFFFNADGSSARAPWLLPSTPGAPLSFVPITGGQIGPSGGPFVYDHFYGPGLVGNGEYRVSFVAAPGLTDPCTINCEHDVFNPRWIPGIAGAGFIDFYFGGGGCCTAVYVQTPSGAQPWVGFQNSADGDVDSFDVSRQGRTMVEFSADGGGPGEPASLQLLRNDTPPPGQITSLCLTENFAPAGAFPRWSPDGRWIAWEGTAGVFTSPAPVPQANGTCRLTPKLIGRGGSRPDWGKQDAPPTGPRCNGKKPTLVGNGRANVLRGTSKADVIVGLGGNDTLNGLKGNDSLCGGAGKDRIKGGTGRDVLLGGGGRDVLLGGGGRDRLVGGPGRDRERQ
jgi:hypothetical protein